MNKLVILAGIGLLAVSATATAQTARRVKPQSEPATSNQLQTQNANSQYQQQEAARRSAMKRYDATRPKSGKNKCPWC